MVKKTALIVFGILLALLIAEAVLLLFYPQAVYFNAEIFSFTCFEEGHRRWIKLADNKRCTLRSMSGGFPNVEVESNSLGLRNPEITKEKPAETKRILFVGDSFTMGWGVAEEEAFPRRVETLLKNESLAYKLETINAGYTAVGPSSYYLYLKNYAQEVDPDMVVVGFYIGNDVVGETDIEWLEKDSEGLPVTIRSTTVFVDSAGRLRHRRLPIQYSIPYLRDSHLFIYLMLKVFQVDRLIPYPLGQ